VSMLVIDAGNTRTRLAVTSDDGLRVISQILTETLTPEQLPSADRVGSVTGVRIAAVSDVGDTLETWVDSVLAVPCQRLTAPPRGDGLINGYGERSADLGIDRWLAMMAARARVSGSLLVVDIGTAVTVDAVSADGQHLGGYIVPGLALARRSLGAGAAALSVTEGPARSGLGTSTEDAILSGTMAQIVSLIRESHADLDDGTAVVITGGGAESVIPSLGMESIHVPELVLEGLAACQPEEWDR
jgi:type III pantothenate kinase